MTKFSAVSYYVHLVGPTSDLGRARPLFCHQNQNQVVQEEMHDFSLRIEASDRVLHPPLPYLRIQEGGL